MESINKEQLQQLADFHGVNCISIYIPTHRYGKEVNEGTDARLLKNHYQKVKNHLEDKGIHEQEVRAYLEPIRKLVDDKNFWRQQQKGLAVFLGEDFFEYHVLPYDVEEFNLISTSFHLEQLVPWFNRQDMFYILGLSLKKVRLFIADEYQIKELNIQEMVPENIEVVLSFYEFGQIQQSPSQWTGSGNVPTYPSQKREKGFDEVYMEEYFRHINDGLEQVITKRELPVVLAAVDYLHPLYKKNAKSFNIYQEGITTNPDELRPDELFEKGVELIKPHFDKPKFDWMERYRELAGTGKASHDIHVIAPAAIDGRIDALFIVKGTHKWGIINREDNTVQLHDDHYENDQCLVSKSAVQTLLQGGQVYYVDKESLPEEFVDADMAAVFRW